MKVGEGILPSSCNCPGCTFEPLVRTYPVWNRKIKFAAAYCNAHAQVFAANYFAQRLSGEGPPLSWDDSVGFDIELIVVDDRPDHTSWFSLGELGGSRILDCATGIFEVAALQRQLQFHSFPRPLAHHVMGAIITSLGGRLQRVVIDNYIKGPGFNFEAKLCIERNSEIIRVDVRPSDAVVLAVALNVSIGVAECVLEGIAKDGTSPNPIQ